jgi:DNA-binding SARP family transcriptional activator/CheY-like chemotaxis protein
MSQIEVLVFGGFQVRVAPGSAVTLASRKGQALLAYLALRRGQPQTRDKLATLLWGETAEDQARNSLRQTLFTLRRALGAAPEWLVAEGETLAVDPQVVWVDAIAFEEAAQSGTPEGLSRAAALYTGDLLDGLNLREMAFEDWLVVERERYRELAYDVLTRLLKHQADTGDTEAAILTAGRLLGLDPLQEAVHRMLIRLYVRQGRRGAAQRQYQLCADIVRRELGGELEPETRRLYEQLVQRPAVEGALEEQPWFEDLRPARGERRPAVLVVEDDRVTRTILERFLADAGYEVAVADNGADALLQIGARRFDVIVSDISMPTLDGLQLLEVLRERRVPTPAIFITAVAGSEVEVRGLQLGAADFLRKPIQKDVLLARIKNVLRRTGRLGSAGEA